MKIFILKTLAFSVVILMITLWVFSNADGHSDPFYVRFTTPKQQSLILVTSRAAQGIQPKVFKSTLNENISNYAFTVAHSPFGKTYFNSIKKKIIPDAKNGTFIIAVDPWSISSNTENPNDSLSFRELDLALAKTSIVDLNPNIFYILDNWPHQYHKLLSQSKSELFLHKDGWLEVDIPLDSIKFQNNAVKKEKAYRENMLSKAHFSDNRLHYLKQTINFLKTHGDVYLVRLPIHPRIMQVEKELMPNFNDLMNEVSVSTRGYLDLTSHNAEFNYTDGNHLHKASGEKVSEIIAYWIAEKMK